MIKNPDENAVRFTKANPIGENARFFMLGCVELCHIWKDVGLKDEGERRESRQGRFLSIVTLFLPLRDRSRKRYN